MDCINNNIEIIKRQNNFICTYKMAYNNACNSINTRYSPFFVRLKKESKIIKYTYTKQHKLSNSVPLQLYNYYFLYKVIYNPTILFIPTNPNSDNGLMYGGLASAITGGDFAQGAAIGLVVTALNHALHAALDPDPKNQQEKNVEKIRKAIAEKAKEYEILDNSKWSDPIQKCNEFVLNVAKEVGANFDKYYNAGDLGNPNIKIKGWEIVITPEPGDIAAFKSNNIQNATGHSGIIYKTSSGKLTLIYSGGPYIKDGNYIRQSTLNVNYTNPPVIQNWVYRRFIGN